MQSVWISLLGNKEEEMWSVERKLLEGQKVPALLTLSALWNITRMESFLITSTDTSSAQMMIISCLGDSHYWSLCFFGSILPRAVRVISLKHKPNYVFPLFKPLWWPPPEILPQPRRPHGSGTGYLFGLIWHSSSFPCAARHIGPFTVLCVCGYAPASGP